MANGITDIEQLAKTWESRLKKTTGKSGTVLGDFLQMFAKGKTSAVQIGLIVNRVFKYQGHEMIWNLTISHDEMLKVMPNKHPLEVLYPKVDPSQYNNLMMTLAQQNPNIINLVTMLQSDKTEIILPKL